MTDGRLHKTSVSGVKVSGVQELTKTAAGAIITYLEGSLS
jgi:hypothetical protein